MMTKTFCETCHEIVTYIVKEAWIEKKIKGSSYKFLGLKAYCTECGGALFVASIHDHNLNMLENEIDYGNCNE